ncbi:MAG: P63C domain-containing protein [Patescibacteria group bacterium]
MTNKADDANPSVPTRAAGGVARAQALTPEERKNIAKEAALTRWGSPDRVQKVAFGSADRPLKLGKLEIPAYVLEDGTRVLVQKDVILALGMKVGGGRTQQINGVAQGGDKLSQFAQTKALKSYISKEILDRAENPIRFKLPTGKIANGYEATLLPSICNAVLESRESGDLNPRQRHIAKQCEVLVRGLATVGIIALVDEATGYQEVRDREALQQILEKYITDEWAKWTRMFPDEYYKELFRLKGMPYPYPAKNTPSFIGSWTNDLVYKRLAPGVLKALREKNPRLSSGSRSRKFHQHLTTDFGTPELKKHLDNLIFLMRACTNWRDFQKLLDKTSPKYDDTIKMDFPSSN